MHQVSMDIVRFKGDHYQFGYKQGQVLKGSYLIESRRKQFNERKKTHFLTNQDEAIELLRLRHAPLIDEIYGLRDALHISTEEAIRHFAGYYIEVNKSGCSIMNGSNIFVRNYDSHPDSYEGRFVMYQPTDGGYRSMGPSMQVTGRTDGINEKGLVVGYNFTNRRYSGDGFICNMIARILLETARDVDEAVKILKELPHRRSFSYVLMDSTGKSVVVEATPRQVVTREARMCTNHFDILKEDNRYQFDESRERLDKVKHHWHNNLSVKQAYEAFNAEEADIFSTDYQHSSGTLHTIVYRPQDLCAYIGVGRQKRPVRLDLDDINETRGVYVKRIKGTIQWPRPYLNERA
ncbi:choloylglycine hydrolase [Halolactibacillus miurensis]|uniref:Choloylglycine hydrolase n=1 Tax=Halolactibacillus miurensis TaxID=306541 RepID=A0A1I6UAX5_9BACI|nr:C45 family peptidase [Halolactibacillus miurensis]GEM05536.1 choloylglycine hydrolase [Halolactibacillus miurensis]SFS98669.1 Predicted choloylglycine hydrolase [Halolactibacillus miurensis]